MKKRGRKHQALVSMFFVATVLLIVILFSVFSCWILVTSGWDDLAAAGSAFGILNTLFSGLALATLVTALLLQAKELRLQRLEFRRHRAELQHQRQELERHRAEFARQATVVTMDVYLRSREETRLTFGKVQDSVRTRSRVAQVNAYCSRMVDEIIQDTPLTPEQQAAIERQRANTQSRG